MGVPIWFIVTMVLAFTCLGYETSWMRIRLPVGASYKRGLILPPPSLDQKIRQQRKWQFLKYGDDCIMMRDRCGIYPCNLCKQGNRFFAWRIPARTVKVFGSTINFKSGCNLYRAKLLKDIVKAQKSKVLPTYRHNGYPGYGQRADLDYLTQFELLIDGKVVMARGNGNEYYKRGMIKEALKPYKVGRRTRSVYSAVK